MISADISAPHSYRTDVDGLRAVAVLAVLLFHAGIPGLSGGYVGVDVFFVISGYLITAIVVREQERGAFSFARFYERRARRILPALSIVVLVTSLASTWLLLPGALTSFGLSVAATALSASNFLFWAEGGYFATSSEFKPLLHTWSLSIEEQFYLLYPALLVLIHRHAPRRRALILACVFLVSLGVSVFATGRYEFAYYLLPSRAWELMCGALLAVSGFHVRSRALRDAVGFIGFGLIAFASVFYSSATAFPGLAALVPCGGAVLLLVAGAKGQHALGSLLSRRPAVFVGKISYSLYLWHWPLLVLPKYYLVRPLTLAESCLALGASFALATASYRFVETPFRRLGEVTPLRVFGFAAATLTLFCLVGGVLTQGHGFPTRVSQEVRALERTQVEVDIPDPTCLPESSLESAPLRPGCFLGAAKENPSFVLWGDSHGAALSPALAREASTAGRSGFLWTHNGCPPLVGATVYTGDKPYLDCERFGKRVIQLLEDAPQIDDVVLVSRWSIYLHGYLEAEAAGDLGPPQLLGDGLSELNTAEDRARLLERALTQTARRLRAAGKRVFVADPIPEIGQHVPTTLARLVRFHDSHDLSLSADAYADRNRLVLDVLERLTQKGLIFRLSPELRLCDARTCQVQAGSLALYADDDHLSHAGALLVAPAFARTFAQ